MRQAFNPYLPSFEYVADGEPYVVGDRLYVFGSHDRFNGTDFCMNDYVGWSAPLNNLGEWKCHGTIYRKEQDPLPNAKEGKMYAPDVQRGMDGRYYLYYMFDNSNYLSVAVCDEPAGKYEFYGYVRRKDGTVYGTQPGEAMKYDPGVLVDDDGSVYLYTGFNPVFPYEGNGINKVAAGCEVTVLEQDMVTVKQEAKVVIPDFKHSEGTGFEGHAFFEAPSIRKFNNRYYLVYSSENMHELCYAISDNPTEGFVYGGTLVSNGDIFYQGRTFEDTLNYIGTNHGGIEKIGDDYYVFYHRNSNKSFFNRQGCADKLKMDENGKFSQCEMTSCGLNGRPLAGEGRYEARIACNLMSSRGAVPYTMPNIPGSGLDEIHPYFTQSGEDREDDPDQYIANMRDRSVAGYKYFDCRNISGIKVEVRGSGSGYLTVAIDETNHVVGKARVDFEKEWHEIKIACEIPDGVHAVYLSGEGEMIYDINSFTIVPA